MFINVINDQTEASKTSKSESHEIASHNVSVE